MRMQFEIASSGENSLHFLVEKTRKTPLYCVLRRMASSNELVWLKRAFFAVRRIFHTASWKNMSGETEIAIKQSARVALLHGRTAGEVLYA